MRKINKQAGFTLIELIMVIVILGVLSAFALPRFANLGDEAREASISALAGAIKAAANISHAQQLADGASGGTGVALEGSAITMVAGYPTANTAGIGAAAQIVDPGDYTSSGGGTAAGDTIVYTIAGTTAGSCQVSYTPTNAVVAVVTGC